MEEPRFAVVDGISLEIKVLEETPDEILRDVHLAVQRALPALLAALRVELAYYVGKEMIRKYSMDVEAQSW